MYVVLTRTEFEGWQNTWTETLPDGTERPTEFDTVREAQEAIDDLVEEMGYDPDDYRIAPKG